MSSVKEVSKILTLDLNRIPDEDIKAAKKEVGDYLIEEILRNVGDGKSPVRGENWSKLNKDYADEFKGGNRTPTMQLYGDLLDSLRANTENLAQDKIKVGHFSDSGQAPKADGHNQHSFEAKLWASSKEFPKRRYIPEADQNFNVKIMAGVKDILDGYRVRPEDLKAGRIDSVEQGIGDITGDLISVDTSDIFSDDIIEALILDAQRRRR
jgi:hypothetical protein